MDKVLTLQELGWDEYFSEQRANVCSDGQSVARVIAVDKDQFLLINESATFRGRLSGRFRHESQTNAQLPAVGDWVCIDKSSQDLFALIHHLLARKTSLQRKAVGSSSDFQMIAANMDVVFIVQSCHYDFNLKRLERYLLMVREGGAEAVIVLTKTDLIPADELAEKLTQIYRLGVTGQVQTLSNITGEGVEALANLLQPARTYCFVGSSGVGKSSLINNLLGEQRLETQDVSASGEGTHTTVRRELMVLHNGAMVIDNPGMREFGVSASDATVDSGFADIQQLAEQCRFRDCTHTSEPGCAVLAALEQGQISPQHLENYIKLSKESAFNQMSYAEKRQKDRDFGKFIQQMKKDLDRDN
ncbi:MAG: ribosome small subunit-dependent GTPase A [Gammaproteobacteria bacterium]|nr:ribosome small subunit-dependent GTPase A [Gammaproteobacteria bacterium]